MSKKITNIPTNMVMGFLGAGKTTAILHLLEQKPVEEKWAVLVNEFGQVGIDGAIFSASGAIVREVPGGCLCCAVGLPFQVAVNRLLKEVKPDRLLIEPTGLGHPKRVLDMLVKGFFRSVLDVRATICLVDPRNLSNSRYTAHENFVDQIALSDVLVANKMDLADKAATELFECWADDSAPPKAVIAQTVQGQLDVAWLDLPRNPARLAKFPNAHVKGFLETTPVNKNTNTAYPYQSHGAVFPEHYCFDYERTARLLSDVGAERIKAVLATDKGWFIFNAVDGKMTIAPCQPSANSRIEIIAIQNKWQEISEKLGQSIVNRL